MIESGRRDFGLSIFCLYLILFCNVICLGESGFLSFTSPQSDRRDRHRLMEGEGELASVPEEKTCVFFYTSTRKFACARNSAGFSSDAGMSAGARGAVNSIATAEVGRQDGRAGAAGVSQSTSQRRGL